MKTALITGTILIVAMTGIFMKLSYDIGTRQCIHNMPEEIGLISHNSAVPDTLIGWQDVNGEIHIGFKH